MKDLELDVKLKFEFKDYISGKNGEVEICDEIFVNEISYFRAQVKYAIYYGHKDIKLNISSPGGEVYGGLAIIRAIKEFQKQGIRFIGNVQGYAMSIAFMILQCCDERIMGKYDVLMCHGASGFSIGDKKDIDSQKKIMDKFQVDFSEIIAIENTSEDPIHHTKEFWASILDESTPQYYDCKEALELGLIDRIEE